MNKEDLIDAIAKKTNLAKTDTHTFIGAFVDVVTDTLAKEDDVRLIGFGTFKTVKRKEMKGRNPRTGAEIKIPATTRTKFTAGKQLADAVNKK